MFETSLPLAGVAPSSLLLIEGLNLLLVFGLSGVPGLQLPGAKAHEAEGAADVCAGEDVEHYPPLFYRVL